MYRYRIRRFKDGLMRVLVWLALLLALIPLISIIGEVLFKGAFTLSIETLTHPMPTVGEVGGG